MSESIDTRNIEALLFAILLQRCGDVEEAKKLYATAKEALKPTHKEPPSFSVPTL